MNYPLAPADKKESLIVERIATTSCRASRTVHVTHEILLSWFLAVFEPAGTAASEHDALD